MKLSKELFFIIIIILIFIVLSFFCYNNIKKRLKIHSHKQIFDTDCEGY